MPNDWLGKAKVAYEASESSAWVHGVVSKFASQGLDVASLFTDAGNPAVALANPHLARPDHHGIVGCAMMSGPDLLTGLGRLVRYPRIVSDAAAISLVTKQGRRWVRLDLFGGLRIAI